MHQPLIDHISRFISLRPADEAVILRLFHHKELTRNDFFLREGKVCRHLAFILKGIFRYYINQEGEEQIYSFGTEQGFLCDYESFVPQIIAQQNIQALEDAELLIISHEDLQEFYRLIPGAERFGRIAIEEVFIQLLGELKSFYTDDEETRYSKLLKDYPALLQRIPQYYIASYIGIKPQSLSRIRRRMGR